MKGKSNELDLLKIKDFRSAKGSVRIKRQAAHQENMFSIICLTKDSCLEYIKNSQMWATKKLLKIFKK